MSQNQQKLGDLDYSDQKLIGRDSELKLLRSLCKKSEESSIPIAIFVRGPSGSGKSLLVNTAFEGKDDILFLTGKFDQYRGSGDALSVIVEAFSELNNKMKTLPSTCSATEKTDEKALLQIIPSLQAASSMGQSWGVEMLKQMLRDFIKKLSQQRRTVLFLDDLQQGCDRSYVELISSFVTDPDLSNFVFIGGIRTDSHQDTVQADSRELRTLYGLPCSTTIELGNLDIKACNELISDLLHMEPERTRGLAAVVHKKTDGNAFFVIQFLQMLERSKLLRYEMGSLKWKFDVSKIEGEANLAANLVDAVVSKIRVLPLKAQQVLNVAGCLGGRFDPTLVGKLVSNLPDLHNSMAFSVAFTINESDNESDDESEDESEDYSDNSSDGDESDDGFDNLELNEILELCTKGGLISKVSLKMGGTNPTTRELYKFTHDKIQQASYMLVEQSERPAFHLRLGRLLKEMVDGSDDDVMLLIATQQLNRGRALIEDPTEKLQLASLNLAAARSLRAKSAFFPACDSISISLELLGEGRWEDQYDLYLETLTTGAQLDYCCSNVSRCQVLVHDILSNAKALKDKIPAYSTLVELHTLNREYAKALNVGYDLLKQLGVNIERSANLVNVVCNFVSVTSAVQKRSDEELLSMPMAGDDRVISIIRTMQLLLSAAFWTRRDNQYAYMLLTMMKLTLKNGMTNMTGAVFSSYAGACGVFGNFDLAKRIGGLAQTLDESLQDNTYRCKSMVHNLVFVATPKSMYYLSLDSFLEAHRIGLEVGDLDHSSLASYSYVIAYYLAGLPLVSLVHDANMFSTRMAEYGQRQTLACLKLYHQLVHNLTDTEIENPSRLEGEIIPDLKPFLESDTSTRRRMLYTSLNLQSAFYFRDIDNAGIAAKENSSFKDADWPGFHVLPDPFYRALVWIEAARTHKGSQYARKARRCIKKMEKGTKQGLVNLYHMTLIAKAEYATLKSKPSQVEQCKAAFDEAVSVSTRSGFTQHAALTNELTARFMLRCGDNDWGTHYIKMATKGYQDWGAHGKVEQLRGEFHHLQTSFRRAKRGSVGIRGRSRFEEADHEDLYKGLKSRDELWSIAISDCNSDDDGDIRIGGRTAR